VREASRYEGRTRGFGARADDVRLLPLESEQREKPIAAAPALRSNRSSHVIEETEKRLESLFGLVPTFLERHEDARAILSFKPADDPPTQASPEPPAGHFCWRAAR